MKKTPSKLSAACIIGLITMVLVIVLGNILVTPIYNAIIQTGMRLTKIIAIAIQAIKNAIGMFLALLIYTSLISKQKLSVFPATLATIVFGIISALICRSGIALLNYAIYFTIGAAAGFIYLTISKTAESVVAQQVGSIYTEPNVQTYAVPQQANPVDMDALSISLLNAIRPSLKAPMTAILCDREQMVITNSNGVYEIQGYVNSQNSYGAMIATDFTAKASFVNGMWSISNVTVGKKVAQGFAKNFASNYIAISIFVGLMSLLGYLILTMVIG